METFCLGTADSRVIIGATRVGYRQVMNGMNKRFSFMACGTLTGTPHNE